MRVVAIVLIVYGMFGLVLAGATAVVGLGLAARAELLTADIDTSLHAAATAVQRASGSFEGFDTSLEEADAASRSAASVVRDSSVTMRNLASAMSVSIFGAQPLLPLARDFERASEQLLSLADDLDRLSTALLANRDDVGAIGEDLALLGERLERLSAEVGPTQAATTQAPPVRALAIGLIVWLALQAAGAVIAGAILLRRARPAL